MRIFTRRLTFADTLSTLHIRPMMKKQLFCPPATAMRNAARIAAMGLDSAGGQYFQHGKNWSRNQVCRQDTFSMVAVENFRAGPDHISYTKQEDYVKINFWLSGTHTTVLDGFGQYEHERPEVFITSGPREMVKVDMVKGGMHMSSVSLCVLRDFFPVHMGIAPEELPEPLRSIMVPDTKPHAFHAYTLTPDLTAAVRAILAAPFAVRQEPIYVQAKAMELMCLLLNRIGAEAAKPRSACEPRGRHQSRLHEAREMLTRRYAEPITLERISREVGLNKMALTSGFRELFGMSVHDYLQKERMDHAYELLQDESHTIAQVAEAVGYAHSCNFSTAFRAHFGCSPQKARGSRL